MKHKLEDIARETGYSTATISRALNGSSWVAEKTRLKIREAARKTGYLSSDKTIALLLPNIYTTTYYSNMVKELDHIFHFSGFRTEVVSIRDLELIEEHNPCAVISIVSDDGLERYWGKKYEVPLICINTAPRHLEGIFSVHSNEEQGMCTLLDHLLSLGHQRIGILGFENAADPNVNIYSTRVRVKTYRQVLKRHGLPNDLIIGHSWDELEYPEAIHRLLNQNVTAVITISESDAMRTLHYLKLAGKRVPEDISLCGWLNEMDLYCEPPITGIVQNYNYLAKHAMAMLNRLLQKEPVTEDVIVDYNFFLRRSTAPPKRSE